MLELVCSSNLARVAHQYTSTLHTMAWSAAPDTSTETQRRYRAEFMNRARSELGIDEPAVYDFPGTGAAMRTPGSKELS